MEEETLEASDLQTNQTEVLYNLGTYYLRLASKERERV